MSADQASTSNHANRRQHCRYRLAPMYTPVRVSLADSAAPEMEGHAYNISRGGLQFELDDAIPLDTQVAFELILPVGEGASGWEAADQDRSVLARGTVIWVDSDEPGPVRMALRFTSFARVGDEERLMQRLAAGCYALAA